MLLQLQHSITLEVPCTGFRRSTNNNGDATTYMPDLDSSLPKNSKPVHMHCLTSPLDTPMRVEGGIIKPRGHRKTIPESQYFRRKLTYQCDTDTAIHYRLSRQSHPPRNLEQDSQRYKPILVIVTCAQYKNTYRLIRRGQQDATCRERT